MPALFKVPALVKWIPILLAASLIASLGRWPFFFRSSIVRTILVQAPNSIFGVGVFLKSYGSEVKDPKYWQELAICLACDHVPGLRMLPPAGRPTKWSTERAREFVRITDELKKKKGRRLKDAASEAAKRLGLSLGHGSPENRYRYSKR